jgi:16S rRNA (cytosine967-C5)-methyltransferase
LADRPPARRAHVDPARLAAFDLIRAVNERDAYANLTLPGLLRERNLSGRDAALATELGYGTVRSQGILDEIINQCSSRPMAKMDAPVRDLMRIGAYQLLRTRIPPHAAVSATVELARTSGNVRAGGFVNAVLRRVSQRDWDTWTRQITLGQPALNRLSAIYAHPLWIAEAIASALGIDPARVGSGAGELADALAADDARPHTHLVARPGRITREELIAEAGPQAHPGPYSPYAVQLDGGDPGAIKSVRDGRAAVQDEGSQLCAIAVTRAPIEGRDERWLDLCAGPGGKVALLAAIAADRCARVSANELHQHRADLVRTQTSFWDVPVSVADAVDLPEVDGGYDRVLLDAPCTGLGALRRRPESRWRRQPSDVAELADLQHRLLAAATRLTRPGGLVAYITCSPHPGETTAVVARAGGLELIDARPHFEGVPELGDGPTVQLWPHRHGTDAMFCALFRKL